MAGQQLSTEPLGDRVDISGAVGILGALAGVGLGGWLGDRSQERISRENERLERRRNEQEIYVEFLSTFRQFRRFLLTEAISVRIIDPGLKGRHPAIEGAKMYWQSVEDVRARLQIVAGEGEVFLASRDIELAFFQLAVARASYGPGEVPDDIVDASRNAEVAFALAAKDRLSR